MKEEIKIPSLGESVTEVTIGTFLKPSGSQVKENEEIVEIETEKVNQLLYAPKTGKLEWKVEAGNQVGIGETIGTIDTEATSQETPPPTIEKEKEEVQEKILEVKEEPQEVKKEGRPRETRRKMSRIRSTIANRLLEAMRAQAMLTTFNEVDMTQIIDLRERYKEQFREKHGVKLGLMSFFVKAVVEALTLFPDFNSYIEKEEIVHREYYDIGIAVGGAKSGLVVPVVRGCDKLTFSEIEKEIEKFARRAREGTLSLADLEGGGFTITNGGVYGSLLSTPLLNPPQVGILGMHKIEKRAVIIHDQIAIRPMMYLALSYDHRLIDGKEAILFLIKIKETLEDPSRLLFLEEPHSG